MRYINRLFTYLLTYLLTFTLECKGKKMPHRKMKLVNWPLMGGLLFGTAKRKLGGAAARPGPSSL